MTNSVVAMRHKITSATDLHGVVRAMKTIAASGVSEFERALLAVEHYRLAVELGLGASLRCCAATSGRPARDGRRERSAGVLMGGPAPDAERAHGASATMAIFVIGSDQGLVGQFNEAVVAFAVATLAQLAGERHVWAVGAHAQVALAAAGVPVAGILEVPATLEAIPDFAGQVLDHAEAIPAGFAEAGLHLFFNLPQAGELPGPVHRKLLPLDADWRSAMMRNAWPSKTLPQIIDRAGTTLPALIGEYLFISIYAACAHSLAAENASRLAAMVRADRNIADLLDRLGADYHRMRQASIDEELFDVISGYESTSESGATD